MFLRTFVTIALIAVAVDAQFACTRFMPEWTTANYSFTNQLMWTYNTSTGIIVGQLTAVARMGWVGIGFHGSQNYVKGDPHNGTTFLMGYLYTNAGVSSLPCVNSYYGEVRANASSPPGGYPTRLGFTPPTLSNTALVRVNNEQLIMNFTINTNTIAGFQATGPYLLVGSYYTLNDMGLTCPAAEGSMPMHSTRLTPDLPAAVLYNDQDWTTHDGVNCTVLPLPNNNNNGNGNNNNNNNNNSNNNNNNNNNNSNNGNNNNNNGNNNNNNNNNNGNNNNNNGGASMSPRCQNLPPTNGSGPSAACQNTSQFTSVFANYLTCSQTQCSCIGGVWNMSQNNCQPPAAGSSGFCPKLSCITTGWKCQQNAIQPLMNVSACVSLAQGFLSNTNCYTQVCGVVNNCLNVQYDAVCAANPPSSTCTSAMSPPNMNPPAACQSTAAFTNASTAYNSCGTGYCTCIGGTINVSTGQCSAQPTCSSLSTCGAASYACQNAAVLTLNTNSNCSSFAQTYLTASQSACQYQSCSISQNVQSGGQSMCTDTQINASCAITSITSPTVSSAAKTFSFVVVALMTLCASLLVL